jgi:hypothetical protein
LEKGFGTLGAKFFGFEMLSPKFVQKFIEIVWQMDLTHHFKVFENVGGGHL